MCEYINICQHHLEWLFYIKVHTPWQSNSSHFPFADNLVYKVVSDTKLSVRLPKKKKNKQDDRNAYDIPRDHHNRALYDIPKSSPASLHYEVASRLGSEASRSYSVEDRNGQTTVEVAPSQSQPKPEDDVEYIYMEDTSEVGDGDEGSDTAEVSIYKIHILRDCQRVNLITTCLFLLEK